MKDYPKSLREESERIARRQLLSQKHMIRLVEFVNTIRREHPDKIICDFDPLDGGIHAECLYVLEAPGRKARDSGFVSRSDDDETAKNFFEINDEVGISRRSTITWNIVPWYAGTGKKIGVTKSLDIRAGLPLLHRLIDWLPRLRVIVLLGRKDQKVEPSIRLNDYDMDVIPCIHPSPLVMNRQGKRAILVNQLRQVRRTMESLA